jgi:hypothetical protein
VITQGFGEFGVHPAAAAGMLRFHCMSADEFFVSKEAAQEGVLIKNKNLTEPMVILQHFGPDNTGNL